MDGVLYDSMPHHAIAWEQTMLQHGLHFNVRDVYINEGRTGQDVIHEAMLKEHNRKLTEEETWAIYKQKTEAFRRLGGAGPMRGVKQVLDFLRPTKELWIVTGSGQKTLFEQLELHFPDCFVRERMITAFDVTHGKPHPEPYLKAWERSGLSKDECTVVENAPLGVKAGKAAGLFTIAVNTGVLQDSDLWQAGADIVLKDMTELLQFVQVRQYVQTLILPQYEHFDKGHQTAHAHSVIRESLKLSGQYPVNPIMCYLIAAYHDIGLKVNRKEHHLHSARFLREDTALTQWFTAEQIELMAQAVEDHRASSEHEPRSIYGAIVAEADRDINVDTIIRRAIQYGLNNHPELSGQQQITRAIEHLKIKYSADGYMKLWLHSERNEQGLRELRRILDDDELLLKLCTQIYNEEKNQS